MVQTVGMRGISRGRAHNVAAAITEDISETRIAVGTKLPSEAQLGQLYNVSRTVVREALSHLQAEGLVETRHGSGTYVLSSVPYSSGMLSATTLVAISDTMDMLELRISLETEGAALAATRRTEDDLAHMRHCLDAFAEQVALGNDAAEADMEFHMVIARATRNRYFEEIYKYMGGSTIPRTRVNTAELAKERPKAYLRRTNFEHEAIYEAILRQDVDSSRASMRMHLVNSRERLHLAAERQKKASS